MSQVRLVATHAATSFKSLLTGQEIKDRDKLITTCEILPNAEVMHGEGTAMNQLTLYLPLSRGKKRDEDQDCISLLHKIYEKYNPSKVNEIPTIILQQFKGKRMFMLARLKDKYNLNEDLLPAGSMSSSRREGCSFGDRLSTPAQMFLQSLGGHTDLKQSKRVPAQFLTAYPDMLPRLCMNRFYAADGVKRASHMSWREIMGSRGGITLLSTHIGITVAYYSDMSKSNSHMVEAASMQ